MAATALPYAIEEISRATSRAEMIDRVRVCAVATPPDDEVFVLAMPGCGDASRCHAQCMIDAFRAKLPLQKVASDNMVSPRSEAFAAPFLPGLRNRNDHWQNQEVKR